MKSIFVAIIFSLVSFECVLSFKYYYITNDGIIHSDVTYNETMDLPKETVALLIYENNVNKTGYLFFDLIYIIL